MNIGYRIETTNIYIQIIIRIHKQRKEKEKEWKKTRSIPKVIKTIKHHKREVHFKTCKKEVICKMMR